MGEKKGSQAKSTSKVKKQLAKGIRQAGFDKKKRKPDDDGGKKPWQKKKQKRGGERPAVPMTRQEKKQAKRDKKSAKPNAEIVKETNTLLFGDPMATLSKEERTERIGKLLSACQGKLKLISTKHDSSRVLQSIAKHGTKEQRSSMFNELKGHYVNLARNKYGHFLLLAFLKYGGAEAKAAIAKEFFGSLIKLATHNDAASVVDYLYSTSKKKEKLAMLEELYSKEFALFDDEERGRTLSQILEKAPDKKASIMERLDRILSKAVHKEILSFRHLHGLALQYLSVADEQAKASMITDLNGTVVNFIHSENGVRVMCECLGYGTAKDRKQLVKGCAAHVDVMARDGWAHLILIRALDVVDDTVLLKSILKGLQEAFTVVEQPTATTVPNAKLDLTPNVVGGILTDKYGAKVLLHLLAPRNGSYFNKDDLKVLTPALKGGMSTSKKDPELRRSQLLKVIIVPLLEAVTKNADVLIRHPIGSLLLYETLREAYQRGADDAEGGVSFADLFLKEKTLKSFNVICALCEEVSMEKNVIQHDKAHLVFKRLLTNIKPNSHEFGSLLWETVSSRAVAVAGCNRGALMLATLVKTGDTSVQKKAVSVLSPHLAALGESAGVIALGKELAIVGGGTKKKPSKKSVKGKAKSRKKA